MRDVLDLSKRPHLLYVCLIDFVNDEGSYYVVYVFHHFEDGHVQLYLFEAG